MSSADREGLFEIGGSMASGTGDVLKSSRNIGNGDADADAWLMCGSGEIMFIGW